MKLGLRVSGLVLAGLLLGPVASVFAYDGSAAANYADTYWSRYNTQWPSFANTGGDCTNFVSQALYAGGIGMRTAPTYTGNAAWFMVKSRKSWSWSSPWVNAQADSAFVATLPGVTQVTAILGAAQTATVPSNASQGDVVFYDWNNDGIFDHEAIIATPDGQSVDAHTNNRYHAYWTLAPYNAQWMTTRIVVFHIPPSTT